MKLQLQAVSPERGPRSSTFAAIASAVPVVTVSATGSNGDDRTKIDHEERL
ncbi:hypothetical protein [Pseudonocardia broussonetiae]|uniref:Uncharacterized protein n=1 Tax=Pseudonocardia broussonetiae TaxID=2736640 RepID=A0A6M6JA91_9PSEU|nr:hypothetical protein [Pseudonocardia broussonetiae]QJY44784.1 hypothetical protein HOP40_02125 [Pseudonocardia broussonetiae]